MRANHKFRVFLDGLLHIVGTHIAALVERKVGNLDLAALFKGVERTQYRVVFQHSSDDVAAGVLQRETLDNHVEGVGSVVAESETVEVAAPVEQIGEHLTGVGHELARFDSGIEARAAGVHSVGAIEMVHEIIHFLRFRERGCRIV